MSDIAHSESAPPAVQVEHRPGRVRVRKRVRVKSAQAVREEHRQLRERILRILFYAILIVGSLLMIWFGLKTFVREPAPPRDTGSITLPLAAERSPA